MILLEQFKIKLCQSGVRGVIASGLRRTAKSIDALPSNYSLPRSGNEFLTWLRFAVPGMIDHGNIRAMEHAISHMQKGKAVVEIGSFCGLSASILSYLLDKYSTDSRMFSCDKWEFEGQHLGEPLGDSPTVTHDMYRAYVRDTFIRSMKTFASARLPHTIECFSDEFFRQWLEKENSVDVFGRTVTLGEEIGFCYIDGNHTYEFAKRDFENAHKALVAGGFILFDDSADGSDWEVNRLTREIAVRGEYELISKYPNYLFRKR